MSSLKTLDKALHLLESFNEKNKSWGVRELAQKLGMSHTIVYRILSTFQKHGFVIKNSNTNRYELDLKFWEYGMLLQDKLTRKEIFRPYMERLVDKTGETAFLSWLVGKESMSIEIVHSPQSVKFDVRVGMNKPLHAGASNKVILAFLPNDIIEEILNESLKSFTEYTVVDPSELRSEINSIKEQGYSVTFGEFTDNVVGVSVPLFDCNQKVFGSLNIAGPQYRISDEKIQYITNELLTIKTEINDSLNKMKFNYWDLN
jgi:DNA-binding IclR family transcriptional regulator